MARKGQSQENQTSTEELRVRIPATISLRDIIFLVGIVISGIIAFASLGSRTSIIESKVSELKESHNEMVKENTKFKEDIHSQLNEHTAEEDKRFDLLEKDVERNKLRIQLSTGNKKGG